MIIWNRACDRLVLHGGSVSVEGRSIHIPTILDVMMAHILLFDHLHQLHIVHISVTPVRNLARPWPRTVASLIGHPRIILIFVDDGGNLSLIQRVLFPVALNRLILHRIILRCFSISVHNLLILDTFFVVFKFSFVPSVVICLMILVRNFGSCNILEPLDEKVILSGLQEEFENHGDHTGRTCSIGRVNCGKRIPLPIRHRPLHLVYDELLLLICQALVVSLAFLR